MHIFVFFPKQCAFCICDFYVNKFFFHAIKQIIPSWPQIRSFFVRKLRKKNVSCWCLGYRYLYFLVFMIYACLFSDFRRFFIETYFSETLRHSIKIKVFEILSIFKKNNENIYPHVCNHDVISCFCQKPVFCFMHRTF